MSVEEADATRRARVGRTRRALAVLLPTSPCSSLDLNPGPPSATIAQNRPDSSRSSSFWLRDDALQPLPRLDGVLDGVLDGEPGAPAHDSTSLRASLSRAHDWNRFLYSTRMART